MLERSQPIPLYYQLEQQLRQEIESGRWPPGTRVPPESELVRIYGVSRITVRTALERLADDGLIERQRGRGTFVNPNVSPHPKIEREPARLFAFEQDILRQGQEPTTRVLSIEEGPPPARMAALLRLQPGESAVRLRRLGSTNGQPLWLESRYFPLDVGRAIRGCDLTSPAVSRTIEEACGRRAVRASLRIEAASATASQARQLQVAPGAAVLLNEFVFYDAAGRALQALHAFFRADRYAFAFEVSTEPEQTSEDLWATRLAWTERD